MSSDEECFKCGVLEQEMDSLMRELTELEADYITAKNEAERFQSEVESLKKEVKRLTEALRDLAEIVK